MREPLLLDQTALAIFETCPRRFQLHYLEHLPWPAAPLDRQQSQAVERGQHFHRLVERYFLGLPVDVQAIQDDVLVNWWQRFAHSDLKVPLGKRLPEHRLTIPAGNSFLTGRFDLLLLGEQNGKPFAQIFDWKTSRPRSVADLKSAWQTRLYLALVAESSRAFFAQDHALTPDRVSITYWYPHEADQPRIVSYSEAQHRQNWSAIRGLVAAIEGCAAETAWPLTDNWTHCRSCMYQVYCGRQEAGSAETQVAEEEAPYLAETAVLLEPQTP